MNIKKEHIPAGVPFEDLQIVSFSKDPDMAVDYLRLCMQDNDPQLFLIALRQVSKALGGIAKVAERTGLNREHLYKTLSAEGNPTWASVNAVVNSLGMRFMLEPIKPPKKKAAKPRVPTTRKSPQRMAQR